MQLPPMHEAQFAQSTRRLRSPSLALDGGGLTSRRPVHVPQVWPLDWRTLVGTMEHRFSLYKHSHARVLLNSEAIAALKGQHAERNLLLKQLADTEQVQLRFWDALVPYQFLMEFSFREGVKAFTLFVIFAPLVLDGKSPALSQSGRAQLLATAQYRSSIFLQSVASAGSLGTAYRALKRIGGNAVRVTTLLDTLTQLTGSRDTHVQERFVEGDYISFQGVDISTPQGTPLVKDLNFTIRQGESLMITGHNGAGKSKWRTGVGVDRVGLTFTNTCHYNVL
jgi:ABC-type uncharacterized transport system fused permease/ATPase subunit